MRVRIFKKAVAGFLTLALSLAGITVFADTDPAKTQMPQGGGAPPSMGSLLTPYVASGVLTQGELDAINAFLAKQDAARKTEMDAMKSLTEDQRKAQMTAERQEPATLKQQLLDNGLITATQATAIDWTQLERPAHSEGQGQTPPNGSATGTQGQTATPPAAKVEAVSQGIAVVINGVAVNSSVKPHADKNGRTLIELRSVAEALGAEIAWDAATQAVTLTSDSQTVIIKINQSAYQVNGVKKTMDTAAVIESGRTMVPVRVIAEALGATVNYDSTTRTVTITQ